ncbi:tellurite resistance TerB family protein [Gallaecimonas xiamenensis]|uniref:Inner membrane protein yebE n=1 Tax=Gallaecimonas xiamenensis 3-C-1 TaxID=745411 RepID=K2JIR9_9GAMM|nr:tellurite resistance TerB family protein [Gallaecimonas xiamenensis]EKE75133.1 hypothetical protein B3C1_07651 [Gallaecimonas xiamenensis 3-C-1]
MNTKGLLDSLLSTGKAYLSKDKLTGDFGKGLLGGGALGLLLGSKKSRGKVAKYGSMAALGVLAYKVYSDWQQQKGQGPQVLSPEQLTPPQQQSQAKAMLVALIAAAKCDGHIDDRERQAIETELAKLEDDPALQQWLDEELRKPVDAAEVARLAYSTEMAAQLYLASLVMVDTQSSMERFYLDELARELKLPPALKAQLEAKA